MTITLAEELVPLSPDDGSGEAKERQSAGEGVREAIRDMRAAMASVTVATIVAATA
ncbi:hypothetical protein ACIQK9_29500 [Streptomyces hydrogenans]|uniref:hypothetical protein n=1 Tax=Streptomyces hydrogenans TaxID=1873719 RepID=UPI0038210058